MNKTKVIATIGPSTNTVDKIKNLILGGMNVARINMCYADYDYCKNICDIIANLNNELGTSVAIMLNLKGPEIRTGKFQNGETFLRLDDKVKIYMEDIIGDSTKFCVSYPDLIKDVYHNTVIKIRNGNVALMVIDKNTDELGNYLLCQVTSEGLIRDNQTVIIPGIKLNLPFLSNKDRNDIMIAHKLGVDFIALECVNSSEDIEEVNDVLLGLKNSHINIICKVESTEGIKNIDKIIKKADGIIIDRGSIGTYSEIENVPKIQKEIINKCHEAGIVSVIATELLSSMESSSIPTRAEINDIANSVLDGTDAVMLCGETTIGRYPIESLIMLIKILNAAENDINHDDFMKKAIETESTDVTGIISHSVVDAAHRLKCSCIVAPTMSGYTARKMSRYRPACPIIAITPNAETTKSLQLHYGVKAILIENFDNLDKIFEISKALVEQLLSLKSGDKFVITGGYPFKDIKYTNFMRVDEI
ncbi:MAG: pyruvate kinase [Bacilli bacterium]|nr:pyruvate kinase [Bacilli bacterium]